MHTLDSSSATLSSVTFISNTATNDGGGMHNIAGSTVLTDVSFTANLSAYGAGLYFKDCTSCSVTSAEFMSNTASAEGGGMYTTGSSPVMAGLCL